MCQTFMPGAKLKDHTALLGDYCERGVKKNRIPFLPSQVRSQICLYSTFKVQSVGTCHLRNQNRESQNTESVICSERSGEDLRNLGWEDQAVVLTLLAFCFLLYLRGKVSTMRFWEHQVRSMYERKCPVPAIF